MKWLASRKQFPLRPITDLRADPLKGAYGWAWYERKPSSLSRDEWRALDEALAAGVVLAADYAEWKLNVT
jgi:hypothetical protein